MQVTVHSIEHATVIDFTNAPNRNPGSPSFVRIQLVDGKSSVIDLLLWDVQSVERLIRAATEAQSLMDAARVPI